MLSTMNIPRFGFHMGDALQAARREMEPFERFFDRGISPFQQADWWAPVALWEDDEHIYLDVEVAGVSHHELELTIHQGSLRLSVERTMPEDKREYWFNERHYGRMDRIIPLPEAVEPDAMDAELRDGILHVVLTKRPEAYSKKITIRSHSRGNGDDK